MKNSTKLILKKGTVAQFNSEVNIGNLQQKSLTNISTVRTWGI